LWSCGGKGRVSKTATHPTDNECSSFGRTQLSDTGVGDEQRVVGQVTRGVAGQGPVDESRNLEHDMLPHRKPGSQCSWQSTGEVERRCATADLILKISVSVHCPYGSSFAVADHE